MVSSLEAVVSSNELSEIEEYTDYSDKIDEATSKIKKVIRNSEGIPNKITNSWHGIFELFIKKESTKRAIIRMVNNRLPDRDEAPQIIKNAYDLRSEILHHGKSIKEGDLETIRKTRDLIPRILASFVSKETYEQNRMRYSGRGMPSL